MRVASVKKNYILNLVNTVSGLLFPLITFPYASRILLAEGIGQVQFFDSIIGYILLISSLGIPLYAVRELARVRDNAQMRSKVATEIILLHTFLTIIAYFIVFIIAAYVTKIKADVPLFLLLSTSLFFTAIGVQWFYQAIEDFKYITIRSIFIKVLATIALFVFVKEKQDIMWYAGINVAASVGNNIFNFIRLRKYITLTGLYFSQLNIARHIKPSLKLFSLNLIISIYILLDSVMLGFLSGDQAVGFYTAASKLTKMSMGIVTALGTVLLPRFSNYISTGRNAEFIELGNKAISFTAALVFPMAIGLIILANPIIMVFSGPTYIPSVITLQIIAPITIFIGFSSLLGMQILYPQGKENLVIAATLSGAIINVTMNLILIPLYAQVGAATSSLIAEFVVVTMVLILGRKHLPFKFISLQNFNYIVGTIIMGIAVYYISTLNITAWIKLIIGIPTGVLIYFTYLAIRRDHFIKVVKEIIFNG
ncbi:MAG: flippase [Bacteroidales bacterium]